ncbi:hypothetical protein EV356DRAFT_362444 [Viridothelium virens]|uniref:C2H2-type domain-containing protein n=1 Tax=Viridothelium virens TaxID=1048519 RepID=A0A6A6HIG3_VIRVR|nr:hypothetical protein EV356DRAFT_362444 [Viridothelium virens]
MPPFIFSAQTGSHLFESDELAFQRPSASSHQLYQYPDHDAQDHCKDCCVDPKCLLNCAECSAVPTDECQECLEECTDDCSKTDGYILDCPDSRCQYLGSYFASEPCTEPCQNFFPGCSDCQSHIPLDFPLDPYAGERQQNALEASQPADAHSQIDFDLAFSHDRFQQCIQEATRAALAESPENQFASGHHYTDISHDQTLSGGFSSFSGTTDNNNSHRTETSMLYPFDNEPLDANESWNAPPESNVATPTPKTRPRKRKRPEPATIIRSPRPSRSPGKASSSKSTTPTVFTTNDQPPATALGTSIRPWPPTKPSRPVTCLWLDSNNQPCNQVLSDSEALHTHLRDVHTAHKHHYCRWQSCGTGFQSKHRHRYAAGVLRHTWGHSGKRPFVCKICNNRFAAPSILNDHINNFHKDLKPFRCPKCDFSTCSNSNLNRHNTDMHSEVRYQCEWCARAGKLKEFPRAPNLARHFRRCKACLQDCEERGLGQAWANLEQREAPADWFPPGYWKGKNGMARSRVIKPTWMGKDFPRPPLDDGGI